MTRCHRFSKNNQRNWILLSLLPWIHLVLSFNCFSSSSQWLAEAANWRYSAPAVQSRYHPHRISALSSASHGNDNHDELTQRQRRILDPQTSVRGGDQASSSSSSGPYHQGYPPYPENPIGEGQQQQQQALENGYNQQDAYLYQDPSTQLGAPPEMLDENPFPETVQERVERWKTQQREQAMLTSQEIPNTSGQQAMSLLGTVSKGARTVIFFLLMWRDISLFETADQVFASKPLMRAMIVTPLIGLFLANMAGAIYSLTMTSSSHSTTKRRLKAILNVDKLLEMALAVFYAIRLCLVPSRYTTREVYMSNLFHSILFIIQCNAFTRVTWNDQQPPEFIKSGKDGDEPTVTDADRPYPEQTQYYPQSSSQYGNDNPLQSQNYYYR